MRTAGTPGAYAAIIRNRGRISGRDYETPVGAVPIDDGFLVALPYGSRASWLQERPRERVRDHRPRGAPVRG